MSSPIRQFGRVWGQVLLRDRCAVRAGEFAKTGCFRELPASVAGVGGRVRGYGRRGAGRLPGKGLELDFCRLLPTAVDFNRLPSTAVAGEGSPAPGDHVFLHQAREAVEWGQGWQWVAGGNYETTRDAKRTRTADCAVCGREATARLRSSWLTMFRCNRVFT